MGAKLLFIDEFVNFTKLADNCFCIAINQTKRNSLRFMCSISKNLVHYNELNKDNILELIKQQKTLIKNTVPIEVMQEAKIMSKMWQTIYGCGYDGYVEELAIILLWWDRNWKKSAGKRCPSEFFGLSLEQNEFNIDASIQRQVRLAKQHARKNLKIPLHKLDPRDYLQNPPSKLKESGYILRKKGTLLKWYQLERFYAYKSDLIDRRLREKEHLKKLNLTYTTKQNTYIAQLFDHYKTQPLLPLKIFLNEEKIVLTLPRKQAKTLYKYLLQYNKALAKNDNGTIVKIEKKIKTSAEQINMNVDGTDGVETWPEFLQKPDIPTVWEALQGKGSTSRGSRSENNLKLPTVFQKQQENFALAVVDGTIPSKNVSLNDPRDKKHFCAKNKWEVAPWRNENGADKLEIMDYGVLSENSKNKLYTSIKQKLDQLKNNPINESTTDNVDYNDNDSLIDTNKHVEKAFDNIPIDFTVDVDSKGQIVLTCFDGNIEPPNENRNSIIPGFIYRSNGRQSVTIVKTSISTKELNNIF